MGELVVDLRLGPSFDRVVNLEMRFIGSSVFFLGNKLYGDTTHTHTHTTHGPSFLVIVRSLFSEELVELRCQGFGSSGYQLAHAGSAFIVADQGKRVY